MVDEANDELFLALLNRLETCQVLHWLQARNSEGHALTINCTERIKQKGLPYAVVVTPTVYCTTQMEHASYLLFCQICCGTTWPLARFTVKDWRMGSYYRL